MLFGGIAKNTVSSLVSGLAYGSLWCVLGPLTMMPLMMGMGLGVNWNAAAASNMLPSLMGHMIFGLVMGFAYSRGDNCLLGKVCARGGNDDESRVAPRVIC